MKNLNFFLAAMVSLLICSCSHSNKGVKDNATCSSRIFKYNGPHDNDQLEKFLRESTNANIQSLDMDTKTSIVKNLRFYEGVPKEFKDSDTNLKKLFATNAKQVFSAIFGGEVLVGTYDTKPSVKEISHEDFNNLPLTNGGNSYETTWSLCSNCSGDESGPCCYTPGDGCIDMIVKVGNTYYRVK